MVLTACPKARDLRLSIRQQPIAGFRAIKLAVAFGELNGLYETRKPAWVMVNNPHYSQAEGRVELFEELRS